jgi:hypothetical protein
MIAKTHTIKGAKLIRKTRNHNIDDSSDVTMTVATYAIVAVI